MFSSNYPPHPGGLEVMARNVAEGLARRHNVGVVSTAFREAPSSRLENGATVYRVRGWHGTERLGVPYPVPFDSNLPAILRSLPQPDAVLTHGALYATTLAAVRYARRWKAPLVLIEHVGLVPYASVSLRAVQAAAWRLLGDRSVERCRAVVTYNARVESWLRERFPSARVRFIGNGVDHVRFAPRPETERAGLRARFGLPADGPVVLFVGRDTGKKNLSSVLAVPRVGFRLAVCGSERELPPDVTNLGVQPYDRMPDLYAAVDVMIHGSVGEGFPLAVQEALASGVPLVVLWDEGYRTLLARETVAACDGLGELGETLRAILQDEGRRSELSALGRAWAVSHWAWTSTIEKYEDLLGEVVRADADKADA